MTSHLPGRGSGRIGLFLFLTSFSCLTMEIVYARIFSVLTYYHFTSMIISVSLLGFGAAGASISLRSRKETLEDGFLGSNLLLFFGSIVFAFYVIIKIGFYPLEWNADWTNQVTLVIFYLVLGLPFFFGGRVISGAFSLYPERANTLYFFDLVGAGLGSLGVVLLFEAFSAPLILHLLAAAGFLALVLTARFGRLLRLGAVAGLILTGLFAAKIAREKPLLVYPPPSKGAFEYAPPWKGRGKIDYSKWSVIERVDVTQSLSQNVWGSGGELSPVFKDRSCDLRLIFRDGILSSGILKVDKPLSEYDFLAGYLMSAPYYTSTDPMPSTVVLGAGGGIDLLIALYHGSTDVTGVELNPDKVRLLRHRYRQYSGNLQARVRLVPWEGRHFLSRDRGRVDVIAMSGLDDYPALSSGAYALSEHYILTVEAIGEMWDRLTDRGVISITRVGFDPPREEFKLVTTMKAALARRGVDDAAGRFALVKGRNWVNVMLRKAPFRPEELARLRDWAVRMQFGFLYLPDRPDDNPVDRFIRGDAAANRAFIGEYPYRIAPATDDAPFFFQFYKWRNLFAPREDRWMYDRLLPLGLQIALFSLIQVTLLGILLIALPLSRLKVAGTASWRRPLGFFSALGIGYILVEIVLIQKLNYFLGGAAYALAVTLFALLTSSGLGSAFARRAALDRRTMGVVLGAVIGLGLVYLLSLSSVLKLLMPLGRPLRIAASVLIIAPLGFAMGLPFPSGIRRLKERGLERIVPWCWGVNSIFTTFGSVIALFTSLSWGFNLTLAIGLAAYGIAYACVPAFFAGGEGSGHEG